MSLTVIIRGLPGAGKNTLAVDLAKRIKRKTQFKIDYKVLNIDRLTKPVKNMDERLDYITTIMGWCKAVNTPLFIIDHSPGLKQVEAVIAHADRSMVISLVDDVVERTPTDIELINQVWVDYPDQLTLHRSTLDMKGTMKRIMELYNLHDRYTN